ncbi:MAG: cobalamin B12-binding domain-containing protein [Deltaproteobacteria bacterium]|nr:cobalamin B12-binding domain-containing protein [Deltaproteobacteria bacterium]
MRIVLIGPDVEENLSLAYLAAALRRGGHEATMVAFTHDGDHERVAARVAALAPDAVGLSMTFQSRGRGFLALAASLRRAGFAGHLTAGGHWASVAAEPILRDHGSLDSILRGEAEDSLVTLADALHDGRPLDAIPGIVLRHDGRTVLGPRPEKRVDLDTLAPPARDDPPRRHLGMPAAPLVASRGCRGGCSFCSIRTFGKLSHGPARRVRSPASVAEEMSALHRERGARIFVFHDDDFFSGDADADRAWARGLGAELAARDVPPAGLIVKARPDDIDDGLIGDLVALGLVRVFLGIETDAPAGLRALGRTLDPGANRRALRILRRRDVFVCSNLLLWEPDTTLEDLRANLDFLAAFPEQIFNLARTELYEGAPLTARMAAAGRLRGDYLGRDYLVADLRTELAWRVFRVALGERCYPLHGVVNAAMGLGYDAHLLRRFHPSERAEVLSREALAVVGRVAGSTRLWLERIMGWAEVATVGPDPEVLQFALDLARAVRSEDATLLAEIRTAQLVLERCARGEPEAVRIPEERRPVRRLGRAALLAASAGLLACAKKGAGTTPGGDAPEHVPVAADASAQTPLDAGEPPADISATADAAAAEASTVPAAESEHIDFRASAETSSWQDCQGGPQRTSSFQLGALLEPGAPAARFSRFEASDGEIQNVWVAPDGRRARGELRVGDRVGRQTVTAVFELAAEGAGTIRRSEAFYQYGPPGEGIEGVATPGSDPQPEPQCYQICDMAAPPPDTLLEDAGPMVFALEAYSADRGWAQTFRFTVGLREDVRGERVGNPTVTCTTGTAYARESYPSYNRPAPVGQPSAPALRDPFDISFDPRPAGGDGRLEAGQHSCEVIYKLRDGGEEREVRGKIHIRIDADGNVQIGPGPDAGGAGTDAGAPGEPSEGTEPAPLTDFSQRAPYPDLPLPLRYAVHVRCLADYGDAVLLEAECPPALAHEPSRLWYASAGRIEPVDGGARAVWHLPDDGAAATALCAVQSAPLDLQIGTWRRG